MSQETKSVVPLLRESEANLRRSIDLLTLAGATLAEQSRSEQTLVMAVASIIDSAITVLTEKRRLLETLERLSPARLQTLGFDASDYERPRVVRECSLTTAPVNGAAR